MIYDFQTTIPTQEKGANLSLENYDLIAAEEAEVLQEQLIREFGRPPRFSFYDINTHNHDLGEYLTLCLTYEDEANEDSIEEYYEKIMDNFPEYWDDIAEIKIKDLNLKQF